MNEVPPLIWTKKVKKSHFFLDKKPENRYTLYSVLG